MKYILSSFPLFYQADITELYTPINDITDFRWHDLRHTWATWQPQAGTPTHELQRIGGWRTGAMVERYAHLVPEHLAIAAQGLDSTFEGYD